MFNKEGINDRFFSLFPGKSQAELQEMFGVGQSAVSSWQVFRSQVPWEKLQKTIELTGVTWDWLLEGREPKYRS